MDHDFWRTVTLGSAAIGQTVFVVLYFSFPWWKSFLGRALFYKGLILGAILDVFVVARIWPEFGAWDEIFIGLYAALAIGIWWQTAAFLVVKLKGRSGSMHRDVV